MSNDGALSMLRDSDLYRLFRQCRQLGALPLVHAENGALVEEVTSLLTYLLAVQCISLVETELSPSVNSVT